MTENDHNEPDARPPDAPTAPPPFTRRRWLQASAAALAAGGFASSAEAVERHDFLYLHGMVWNTALPAPAGELLLSFDLKLDMKTGTGFGNAGDPVHPEAALHFAVTTVRQRGNRIWVRGHVIRAADPANVGVPVEIDGIFTPADGTGLHIRVGADEFRGAGAKMIIIMYP
jgi:hypothetical protein